MPSLFAPKNPYNAEVGKNKFLLSVSSASFKLNNRTHLQKIIECTAAVNEHQPILQSRDKHIAIGFTVAGAALALSSIIPFGLTIAMTGVAYGAYFLGGRDEPYNNYNAALEELAHCCDWALSDVQDTDKFKNGDINAMLKALAPRVTKEDLIKIMGNDKEAEQVVKALDALYAQELSAHTNQASTSLLDLPKPVPYKLATRDEMSYHLYGYQQGGSLESLGNVVRIYFQKAFAYVCNLFTGASSTTPDNSSSPRMTK